MRIVFDDAGYKLLPSGNKDVDGFNTISIDGSNMIDLFPNEAAKFQHAARYRVAADQAASIPVAPAPLSKEDEMA